MNSVSQIINDSLIALFEKAQGEALQHKALKVQKNYESHYEVSCHISFCDANGKRAGVALLNIQRDDVFYVWEKVFGMPVPDGAHYNEIAKEITNMVIGNATANLSENGFNYLIALPYILEPARPIQLSTLNRDDFHYFEFFSGKLRFNWVLCIYDVIEFSRR